MNTIQFIGSVEIGLVYSLVAMGIFLTFRISDFPDLTVDGSFPLGAAVAASLILKGIRPEWATLLAVGAGALSGIVTGYLHVKLHILGLLAGILTMFGLYSINLRIMQSPNLPLINEPTLFTLYGSEVLILSVITIIVGFILLYFLSSNLGLALRASGSNKTVSAAYGINTNKMTVIALAISNSMVALSGALFAQSQGFADISMGTGTVVIGLASLIIGETLIPTRKLHWTLLSCFIGAIAYRLVIAIALNAGGLGLKSSDLNLITALLVVATMVVPNFKSKFCFFKKVS
jgi:putative ABC transport system permease protein